jgi:hypothetical protein
VAVQNYITAILIFLVIEMLMTWGFYGKFAQFLLGGNGLLTTLRLSE